MKVVSKPAPAPPLKPAALVWARMPNAQCPVLGARCSVLGARCSVPILSGRSRFIPQRSAEGERRQNLLDLQTDYGIILPNFFQGIGFSGGKPCFASGHHLRHTHRHLQEQIAAEKSERRQEQSSQVPFWRKGSDR